MRRKDNRSGTDFSSKEVQGLSKEKDRETLPVSKTAVSAILCNHYDYLIVGSGLYGSTFAREMTDHGKTCLVIDKRPYPGGNVFCEMVDGITVHRYGAHIFHTNNKTVWDYICRFAKFLPYTHKVVAKNGNGIYSLPFNMYTFYQMWGIDSPEEAKKRISEQSSCVGLIKNLEDQAISLVGYDVYEKLVKYYTQKQWGKSCKDLPTSIIKRIPLRFEYDDRYFTDRYQGIPDGGYNALVENMLSGIPIITRISYQQLIKKYPNIAKRIVYTGPIDEFFHYELGELEYRSLRFETFLLNEPDFQGYSVVNYCDAETPFTRIIEHKHFTDVKSEKTVITCEYPEAWKPGKDAYYPINDNHNNSLHQQYLELAAKRPEVIFGGRLGAYKYYNMDEAVAAAIEAASKERKENS